MQISQNNGRLYHLKLTHALREMIVTFKIKQHAEGRGLWETREMSSILKDKSPALPSTACPWSFHCSGPHTRSESVAHCPWGMRTHWHAETYHCSCSSNTHNHGEARMAALWAWTETERFRERFRFCMRALTYIVASLLSGYRWSEADPACNPLSVSI